MKDTFVFGIALLLGLVVLAGPVPVGAGARATYVTIGTGGTTGIYYPTGAAIARMVNKKSKLYGIRATIESTGGSAFNVNAVMSGDLEFGIVQSDRQYQAAKGLAEWSTAGPQKGLRAVFSIHPEAVTLVASIDSGIKTFSDLRGKRVNIGNPGSGQHQNSIDALAANGLDWQADVIAEQVAASEAPPLLQGGRIDAFFYTVGHPSAAFIEATTGPTRVRFVEIPNVEQLIDRYPYYAPAYVPVAHYPGAENEHDVNTFGVKATFVTSASMAEEVVYVITKEVFENFEAFRKLQPAFEMLTQPAMLEGLTAPIHPGAMRYYREAGLK